MSAREFIGPLFSKLLARSTDPPESHKAAAEVSTDGTVTRCRMAALAAVQATPGRTAQELEVAADVQRSTFGRRLGELEAAGLIVRGPPRRCEVTGRTAATWRVG